MKTIVILSLALLGVFACQTHSELGAAPSTEVVLAPDSLPKAEAVQASDAQLLPYANLFAANAVEPQALPGDDDFGSPLAQGCNGVLEKPMPMINIACCPSRCRTCAVKCPNTNDGDENDGVNYCCSGAVRKKGTICGSAPCVIPSRGSL